MHRKKNFLKILIIARSPIITCGLSAIIRKIRHFRTRIWQVTTKKDALKISKSETPEIIFIHQESDYSANTSHQPRGKKAESKPENRNNNSGAEEITSFDLCRRIKNISPESAVIIFSVGKFTFDRRYRNELPVYESVRNGASGYLMPDATPTEIKNAIHSLARGEVFLNIECASELMDSVRKNPYETTALMRLSPVEIKILKLAAYGFSNKAIARKLKNSTHTIKNHISSIISKLGAASRTNAVAIAIRKGFIPF